MNIRVNALANTISQGVTLLAHLLVLPAYLYFLGEDAYGIFALHLLIQSWLALFDFGLTPALARQVAVRRGQSDAGPVLTGLLRCFEIVFFVISCSIVTVTMLFSQVAAESWLGQSEYPLEYLSDSLNLIAAIGAMRLMASLYRSVLIARESQVCAAFVSVVFTVARFGGGLFLVAVFDFQPLDIFRYLFAVTFLEAVVFAMSLRSGLGFAIAKSRFGDWPEFLAQLPFAARIAYSALLSILITQWDKLLLSALLPFSEFGYYTLVGMLAAGIVFLSVPIWQAVLPQLTRLSVLDKSRFVELYRRATKSVVLICVPVAMFQAVFAKDLLLAWTHDHQVALWGGPILVYSACGYGFLALGSGIYFLQNAIGNLRMHTIGATISVVLQLPIVTVAAWFWGALGAVLSWCIFRGLWFMLWSFLVHQSFLPGFHRAWLLKDVLPAVLGSLMAAIALKRAVYIPVDPSGALLPMVLLGCQLSIIVASRISVEPRVHSLTLGLASRMIGR